MRDYDVALCGYYGFQNLGDDLLAASLVKGLEELGVSRRRMLALSASPDDTRRDLGIEATSRWSVSSLWRALKSSRTLLFGGGGLLQDATSLRSCTWYWGVVRMACLAGAVPWAFGQSVGPLTTRTGRFLAKDALSRCSVRAVRDEMAMTLLGEWGLDAMRTPDPVFLLAESLPRREQALLVNVRPWKGSALPLETAKIATAVAEKRGFQIIGVALSPEDEALLDALVREGTLACTHVVRVRTLQDAKNIWAIAGGAVGMRLHFLLLSVAYGCPAIAVPYDPKVVSFARHWNLPLGQGEAPPPELGEGAQAGGEAALVREALARSWELVNLKLWESEPNHG